MMPYQSMAQMRWAHTPAGVKALGGKKRVKEWDRATKGRKLPARVPKHKIKISISKKRSGNFAEMNPATNKIKINIKKHIKNGKLDKAELASTVKHEMLHVTHPHMTEKEVYKKTAKTKIPPQEQSKLLGMLKRKAVNSKVGALKRKYKLGKVDVSPGTFISKMNSQKATPKKVAIMGA